MYSGTKPSWPYFPRRRNFPRKTPKPYAGPESRAPFDHRCRWRNTRGCSDPYKRARLPTIDNLIMFVGGKLSQSRGGSLRPIRCIDAAPGPVAPIIPSYREKDLLSKVKSGCAVTA